ncbi:MAG: lipoyl(octanoyl) transferase LipB [Rhodospirillales bacterium]|nr:lipoyl(octanoyl) transferase LipB [Rhodospirillales bacterium]
MVNWIISSEPVDYPEALTFMEARIAAIRAGTAPESIWLLEHASLYTAGTSAKAEDLRAPNRFPVFKTGRGGQYTYHGPGQRIAYVMLDLRRRSPDLRAFVRSLEDWIIATLAHFGVGGERREGRVGIWVPQANGREDKIAAIGVRVRHWVTFHGISINRDPVLEHFSGIVPCGIADPRLGVTSLAALGKTASDAELDRALKDSFEQIFGLSLSSDTRESHASTDGL